MLDLSFVRANLELVEQKLRDRGQDPAGLLGDFRALDQNRRERITEAEQLKAQRNKLSEEVGRLKKSGQDATPVMEETRALKSRIEELGATAAEADQTLSEILSGVPNLPLVDVPVGKSEQDNVEIRKWGELRGFDFEPRPHWEIGKQLGILDLERLTSRITLGLAAPRELVALRKSLAQLPLLKEFTVDSSRLREPVVDSLQLRQSAVDSLQSTVSEGRKAEDEENARRNAVGAHPSQTARRMGHPPCFFSCSG